MLRVPFSDLEAALIRAVLALGLKGERAALCARLFAETTRDGVYTHGLNRFPRFQAQVANGSIDPDASPVRIAAFGCLERWEGHRGPGNLAAHASMSRAIELARTYGLGAVALSNTNHWMRGGSYGWLAAEAGVFGVCWTNTMPNLPAWGSSAPVLGNNPLVLAVPHAAAPIVLDMAMSQFSYGTLAGVSQFFLAIDPASFASPEELDRIANAVLASIHTAAPLDPAKPPRYPGEQTLHLREENLRLGVPVDPEIWQTIQP